MDQNVRQQKKFKKLLAIIICHYKCPPIISTFKTLEILIFQKDKIRLPQFQAKFIKRLLSIFNL